MRQSYLFKNLYSPGYVDIIESFLSHRAFRIIILMFMRVDSDIPLEITIEISPSWMIAASDDVMEGEIVVMAVRKKNHSVIRL